MFGRCPKPKDWQGFSTIKDEADAPFQGGPSALSRFLVLAVTFILAVVAGALAGFVFYFYSFSRMGVRGRDSTPEDFYGMIMIGVIGSVGLWAWACFKEKQTRYVAEHYKDARQPYKRPETERERVWRERQVERELALGGRTVAGDAGKDDESQSRVKR